MGKKQKDKFRDHLKRLDTGQLRVTVQRGQGECSCELSCS